MREKDYYGAIKGFCLKWNLPEVWNSDRITGANLIYEVIKVINAMILEQKAMKEMIEEFLLMFNEDLDETVKDQLTVWLNDGTLGDVINETLFNSKADKVDFEPIKEYVDDLKLLSCLASSFGVNVNNDDNTEFLQNAIDNCDIIQLPQGIINIKKQLYFNKETKIIGNNSTIKYTGSEIFDFLFEVKSFLSLQNINIVGTKNVLIALYSTRELPNISDCSIKGFLGSAIMCSSTINGTSNSNASGYLKLNNVQIDDCGKGLMIYGSGNTKVSVVDCIVKTDEMPYFITNHNRVDVIGGSYECKPGGATNVYICENVTISNGLYSNMYRGVTIGRSTKYFNIFGNVIKNCSLYGLSIDTRVSDTEWDYGHGVVESNIIEDCGISMRIQAHNTTVANNKSINHKGNSAISIQFSENCILVDNDVYGGNGKILNVNESIVNYKNNTSTVKDSYPITNPNSYLPLQNVDILDTIDENISNDVDLVIKKTEEGSTHNLRLPNKKYTNMTGRSIQVANNGLGIIQLIATNGTIDGLANIKLQPNTITNVICVNKGVFLSH